MSMTPEEAIAILKANYPDACYEQLREAVDMAISALQVQDVPDIYAVNINSETQKELETLCKKVAAAPIQVVQEPSEITDEQAILHLQSTGWMQNHDCEMYKSGLRERLADDSGDYDSLIPCEDTISRQAAVDVLMEILDRPNHADFLYTDEICKALERLPSAQPEIVRCKDCKHSEHWYKDKRRCFLWHEAGIDVFEDGYCNYAERRTDEQITE